MKRQSAAIYAALFVSGAAALVYELVWSRMLQRVFGVSDLAVATVLAAYFLGLGLGNALGGGRALRLARPGRAYVALEASVALFALLSLVAVPLIHRVYAGLGEDASFLTLSLVRLLCSLAVLLPPTVLMGATLPVLIAAMPKSEWARHATRLYAINTLGAVVGAGGTGLFLVPHFGARAAIVIAAALSVVAAAIVFAFVRGHAPTEVGDAADAKPAKPNSDSERSLRLASGLAFFAGLLALAGEVVWTRVLRLVVQGTTQAFAAMLVSFLFGIALGGYIAGRVVRSSRSAARSFGYTQVGIAVLSACALAWTNVLPRLLGLLQGQGNLSAANPWIVLLVAASLLLPLAVAIGASVPLAWHMAAGDGEAGAYRAGRVLAANTLGGLCGSLLAGFTLIPSLGVNVTILILVMMHLAIGGIAMRAGAGASLVFRVGSLVMPVFVALLILLAAPQIDLAFLLGARENPTRAILEGAGPYWRSNTVRLWEGRNTTVTVTQSAQSLKLFNDGRPESGFSLGEPGFGPELAMLGALPGVYAPSFDRAMVIGLGAGHTTAVMMAGPWKRLDVVELEESVVTASRFLYEQRGKPWPLSDPRAHLYVDDARARLLRARPGSYDAVVSQPSHPWLAGSSALYTTEFFGDVKRALKPGGVFVLWINLFRNDVGHVQSVVRTLLGRFANVNGYLVEGSSLIFCASDRQMPVGPRLGARLAQANTAPFFGTLGFGTWTGFASTQEFATEGARAFAGPAQVLVDDRPLLEFDLSRLDDSRSVRPADLDVALRTTAWLPPSAFADANVLARAPDLVRARVLRIVSRPDALARILPTIDAMDALPADTHEMRGLVAEASGELTHALREYDDAATPSAARAYDSLRVAEREYEATLQHASARAILPTSAMPLIRAAFALGTPEALAIALRIGDATHFDAEAPMVELMHALSDRGCAEFVASPILAAALDVEEVAVAAERCAISSGDRARVSTYAERRVRTRRVAAAQLAEAASLALSNRHQRAAVVLASRALAANSAHADAASTLARALVALGSPDRAGAVLHSALQATRGLPQSTSRIISTASELHLDLAAIPSIPRANDTSASTAAPPEPTSHE
ncbi:MAG: fused MFS/spermidine synthase [Sandaracinaceae bacterium]|nr:fused MFS/spermidine synthase [Sandaracinaceae bacterium]